MLDGLEAGGHVDTGQGTYPRGQGGAGWTGERAPPRGDWYSNTRGRHEEGLLEKGQGKRGEADNSGVNGNDKSGLQAGYQEPRGKRKSF